MGTDILIYRKCRECKHLNQFELYRTENEPFDINNKEMWALLNKAFKDDIADIRKEFKNISEADTQENRDGLLDYSTHQFVMPQDNLEEDFYVAANLKFIDDGAFNFLKCEKCGKILDFYIISV